MAAIGALLVGCTGDPEPIRIGAVYPLSGSQGPGGIEEFHGARIAAELVNRAGGIDGRSIQLRPIDVPSSDVAAAAVSALEAEGVDVVLGSYGSTISAPAADEAASRGMLYWETGAVGEMSGRRAGELVFRMPATGGVLGRGAIGFVVDRLAPMLDRRGRDLRFAITNVDDVYGRAVADGAAGELDERGFSLVGRFPYDPPTLKAGALVADIASANPDVLFVASYLDDAVAVRREMLRAGLPLVASIGTSSSYCMLEFGKTLGREAVGLFASDKPDAAGINPAGLSPSARELLVRANDAYRDRYGVDMTAPALAGFTGAWALFHEVMPSTEELTPGGIAAAARQIRIPLGGLPNGSGLEFGPPGSPAAGENLRAASVIWEWTDVEERVIVWPPAFATEEIRAIPPSP